MTVDRSAPVVRTGHYQVRLDRARLLADLAGADGRPWARLRLLASVDGPDGPDETVRVDAVEHGPAGAAYRVTVRCTSSRWDVRTTTALFGPDEIAVSTTVEGHGRLGSVHQLGGWRLPQGFLPSGAAFRTVFSPNPDHPRRIARPATEPAVIGVTGEGSEPGVGRWLFTPAPTCLALSCEDTGDDTVPPDGEWLVLGLAAAAGPFTRLGYDPTPGGFSLRLDYEGHTEVAGSFAAPPVLLLFGARDPYDGIRRYRTALQRRGLAPAPVERPRPAAWRQPIFSGWGAQCHLARRAGRRPQDFARQDEYDRFLDVLARHGVVPGTIVVDDKWQRAYASCRADPGKWPDLRGWIADRHARGQRVLLWWKAWDPEGAPAEACVRDPLGRAVALDPDSGAAAELVDDAVRHMLSPQGLDADGLKVDFTGRTPSGTALVHSGRSWGNSLLHRLLEIAYRAAKRARPDALVVTHTPSPAFVDVADMVRLNDALMLDHPEGIGPIVGQMTYRARVAAAACPELLVDTDDWCAPNRREWRYYLRAKPALGVPALYYATHLDLSGEALTAADYAAIRASWRRYRTAHGLPQPAADGTFRPGLPGPSSA